MLFPTIEFAIFFLVVFPATWSLNNTNTLKKAFLLGASYTFYSFWDWHFVFLLVVSSLGNFAAGLAIAAAGTRRLRHRLCGAAVALNLVPLGFFKYFDFGRAQLETLLNLFGFAPEFGAGGYAVPVAISFLTFHGISYVVDVCRRRTPASRSPLDVMLYAAFFPHLVAGPIVRAADFLGQLARPSDPRAIAVGRSLLLILGGLFKKVVIASHLSTLYVDPVFTNPQAHPRIDLVGAAYAYAIVIYCDFSAYTDMAIGIADLLGYKFPQNFDQPYRAASLQDFWRRWHMTLSSWLRDYLYIPLGGSRGGRVRTYRNLLVTMVLGGLWHGAALQFVLWGALHGLGLAAERLADETLAQGGALRSRLGGPAGRAARWFLTFNFVCVTWILFRCPDIATACAYFSALLRGSGEAGASIASPTVAVLVLAGALTQAVPPNTFERLRESFEASPLWGKVALAGSSVWMTLMLAPEGMAPFIYFQF